MPFARDQEFERSGNSPRTILVVEDEILIRLLIAEHLRDCGFKVREAGNAAEAKELLVSAGPIDLVLSDVNMPGGEDGIALAHWIVHRHPMIPIILTSALPPTRGTNFPFLAKPYDLEAAVALILLLLRDAATGG